MTEKDFYANVIPREDWSFSHLSRSETRESAHSYHKYPAKFIPQLARVLIEEFTEKSEVAWDPFCGSGTLNLEALRSNRKSIGTDINPVAILISKAKTTPIEPCKLEAYCDDLLYKMGSVSKKGMDFYISEQIMNGNIGFLKKWFSNESLLELSHILWLIRKKEIHPYQNFALCAFSSVLKRSSYWLNTSIKCQFDPHKNPKPPSFYFRNQINEMKKVNSRFYMESLNNRTPVQIFNHDSRTRLPLSISPVDCIITSPPYLVSYDYSDIFRLSSYFLFFHDFGQQEEYQAFRKKFIGTPLRKIGNCHIDLDLPELGILDSIPETSIKRNLFEYYKDMKLFFENVQKALRKGGMLIMVIGDSEFKKVKISNAYLLSRIAESIGWSLINMFKREVPAKILPTVRNPKTGKFCARKNNNHSEIYSKEYILIFRR